MRVAQTEQRKELQGVANSDAVAAGGSRPRVLYMLVAPVSYKQQATTNSIKSLENDGDERMQDRIHV